MDYQRRRQVISYLTETNILDFLACHGATPIRVKDNEFWFRTVCHGGNSDKLCYFRDTKQFRCYTNCGQMDFITLFSKLEHCSENDAINIILTKYASMDELDIFMRGFRESKPEEYSEPNNDLVAIIRELEYANSVKTAPDKSYDVPPEMVMNLCSPAIYKGWVEEGIDPQVAYDFGIRRYNVPDNYCTQIPDDPAYDNGQNVDSEIIIPHYDENRKLIGIRRRTIRPEDTKNKYMPFIFGKQLYSHPLGINLYGIDMTFNKDLSGNCIILFESEKSVLQYYSFITRILKEQNIDKKTYGEEEKFKSIVEDILKINVRLSQINKDMYGRSSLIEVKKDKDLMTNGFKAIMKRLNNGIERLSYNERYRRESLKIYEIDKEIFRLQYFISYMIKEKIDKLKELPELEKLPKQNEEDDDTYVRKDELRWQAEEQMKEYEEEKNKILLSRYYDHGYPIAMATCGHSVSGDQLNLLSWHGAGTVCLAFDNDFNYRDFYDTDGKPIDGQSEEQKALFKKYEEGILRLCKKFNGKVNDRVYLIFDYENVLGPKDSPTDRGEKAFTSLFDFNFKKRNKPFIYRGQKSFAEFFTSRNT